MDNRHRDRDWPNLVVCRDVRVGPRGRLGFVGVSDAPYRPRLTILSYGASSTELTKVNWGSRTMLRGLGVHWMDVLYFVVVSAGIIAGGYYVARRR
jgi:hypothetical protein